MSLSGNETRALMVAYLILLFGVFACSTSVIFIKLSETDPVALSAYRLLLGGVLLLPLAVRSWRRGTVGAWRESWRYAWPPALLLSWHFMTWIYGARLTPAANSTLIVNMVPVVMPFLLYMMLSERLSRREVIGTLLAISGLLFLGIGDYHVSREYVFGDITCFVSMLLYAGYLTYGRKNKELPSIYVYVVPVYILGGVFCLVCALGMAMVAETKLIGTNMGLELLCILGLAVVPTVVGHSIINWALRHLRGQTVALVNLAQFIFAGTMGWLLLGELPGKIFYIASALVVAGALTVIVRSAPASLASKKANAVD